MKNSAKGLIFILLSSLGYAFNGLLSKVLINIGLDPLFTVTLRNLGCFVVLGAGVVILNPGITGFLVKKGHIKDFIIAGCFTFVYSAAYFFALVYLNYSVAVILLYTYPAMVVVVSVLFYKEPLNKFVVVALVLTFIGLLLTLNVFTGDLGNLSPLGVFLALSGAVGAAGYALWVKKLTCVYGYSGFTINFYCFMAAVAGYSLLLVFNPPEALPAPLEIGYILFAVVPYTFALLFYAAGLKYLSPGKAGIVGSSEPAFGVILSVVFLGEYISGSQWLGALAVLGAILIIQIFAAKDEEPTVK